MGSSIVTICSWRSRLILSIIDASVVDLPLPVGPVTNTRPRGNFVRSATTGGNPEIRQPAYLIGDQAECATDGTFLQKQVAAEPAQAADAEREIELVFLFEPVSLAVGEQAVTEILRFVGGKRRHRQRCQLPVNPHQRRTLTRDVEIRRPALHDVLQKALDAERTRRLWLLDCWRRISHRNTA